MTRLRLASVALSAAVGFLGGCSGLSGHKWFSSASTPPCTVVGAPGCETGFGDGPMLGDPGPMMGSQGAILGQQLCPQGQAPILTPTPQAPLPQQGPPQPRLVPTPQAPASPYNPQG